VLNVLLLGILGPGYPGPNARKFLNAKILLKDNPWYEQRASHGPRFRSKRGIYRQ